MNQLRIVVDCSSMLISTQLFRFSKAVENFYYALLFSSEAYAGEKPWDSWAEMGLSIAVRSAPPGAKPGDRLTVDTAPGRTFEITASSGNRNALTAVSELLREIERTRTTLGSQSGEALVQALLDHSAIKSRLVRPVRESLERNAVPKQSADAIWSMVSRGLGALTNSQIKSVNVAVS